MRSLAISRRETFLLASLIAGCGTPREEALSIEIVFVSVTDEQLRQLLPRRLGSVLSISSVDVRSTSAELIRNANGQTDANEFLHNSLLRDKSPASCILGITNIDLSYFGRTFVFGEADERRRVAVLSLNRLRPSKPND